MKLHNISEPSKWGAVTIENNTDLHVACFKNNLNKVKEAVNNEEIDLNFKNTGKETAFFLACRLGYVEIVSYLLSIPGIDINQPNTSENGPMPDLFSASPLFSAYDNDHPDVVRLLLADPRIDWKKSEYGGNQWHSFMVTLCFRSHAEQLNLLEIILEEHSDMAAYSSDNQTPLFFVCTHDFHQIKNRKEIITIFVKSPNVSISIQEKKAILALNDKELNHLLLTRPLEKVSPAALKMALVVYFTDELYTTRNWDHNQDAVLKAQRFFKILEKLPADLQSHLINKIMHKSENLFTPTQEFKQAEKWLHHWDAPPPQQKLPGPDNNL